MNLINKKRKKNNNILYKNEFSIFKINYKYFAENKSVLIFKFYSNLYISYNFNIENCIYKNSDVNPGVIFTLRNYLKNIIIFLINYKVIL